jgi:eukaryotic-like serine/threonine-protein kinase
MMRVKAAACIILLLALTLFVSDFSLSQQLPIQAVNAASNVNGTTSAVNITQYEWPQIQGDASFTRFSQGPAPEAPDILWKTNMTGIQSYVAAFNGKIFVTTSTRVIALDKDTGAVVWNSTVQGPDRWPTVYKIDETHMIVGKTCFNIDTGTVVWVSTNFSPSASDFAAGCYSAEQEMFYVKTNSSVQAWNFSDPSNPPSMTWQTFVSGAGDTSSGVQYGDGKVFPGSFLAHQVGLDAKNGSMIWDTETKASMLFSGTYYNGKFLRGGTYDNTYYCFDTDTGKILWNYTSDSPNGYWASGSAAAYGMVYAPNMDGYLYALDVNTGALVWRYKGPSGFFIPGYPTIADGKVYLTTSQKAAGNATAGTSGTSEFACFDAFTGKVVWTLPIEAYAPRESVAIAYGNLYLIPGFIQQNGMDVYSTFSQVWALGTQPWSMFLRDAQHSSTGQAGPLNLTLRWTYTTTGAVTSSPSAVEGKIYVASQDFYIYCLDSRTGSLIWKYKTNGRIESSPAIANGRLFIVSDDGYLYSLNSTNGAFLWKKSVGSNSQINLDSSQQIRSSPTVFGSQVYVGSVDSNLYCLETNTGNIVWTFKTNGTITSSPAATANAVYITSEQQNKGSLYKIDPQGYLLWQLKINQDNSQPSIDLSSSPMLSGDLVYVSAGSVMYAVHSSDGSIAWSKNSVSGFLGSPLSTNGQMFFTDGFFIISVNASTGGQIWRVFSGASYSVAPSYADGKLYLASDLRLIYVVNATDGQKLSWFTLGSNAGASPTVYEGKVYVGSQDWNLYCLANYPSIFSNITLYLDKTDAISDDQITGHGQLTPGLENATIIVTMLKPDGTSTSIQTKSSTKGQYTFTFIPHADLTGNWTLFTQWNSDKGFYSSATSTQVNLTVHNTPTPTPAPTPSLTQTPAPTETPSPTPIPFDKLTFMGVPLMYLYIAVVAALIAVIVVAALIYARKTPK